MDIQWHGLSCFSLRGKTATLVTDPYDAKSVGAKSLKLNGDVVVANMDFERHHAVNAVSGAKVFDWPGEYEAKNIIVQAIPAFDRPRDKASDPTEARMEDPKKDNANRVLIFSIQIDGFRICHLSNLGHKLTPEMLEMIGNVDILLVPVGGEGCLDAKKAHEVIEQIDPRIVIPMYYKIPGMNLSLGELDGFLKEVGLHAPEKEKVLKFAAPSNLPQDKMEFKILEPMMG